MDFKEKQRREAQFLVLARNPGLVRTLLMEKSQLPEVVEPSSPLISLIERIEKADRGMIWHVRLSPSLGYNSDLSFPTANALLKFLKPGPFMYGSWPADELRIKDFNQEIDICVLLAHCEKYPRVLRLSNRTLYLRRNGNGGVAGGGCEERKPQFRRLAG